MKRGILSLLLLSALLITGCGAGSSEAIDNSPTVSLPEASNHPEATGASDMQAASTPFHTQEIWCENNGKKIYGIAYIPDTQEEKKPLVIFSHELGNTHMAGIPYAERLAAAGYAAYTFDFCGGTVGNGNRSDGVNTEMSVITEMTDLEAVLDAATSWDFVDPARIVLLGGSQGGAVTALTGCRNPESIAGMILLYPALNVSEDVHRRFDQVGNIPEEYDMFGGWIRVGRNYATDIWDIDFLRELSQYPGDVLLLHGDRDSSVDISYSERAASVIPNCEYHVIAGGGHEFFGKPFEAAVVYILNYLNRMGSRAAAGSAEPGVPPVSPKNETLSLRIGDTPVSVEWEKNGSVEALRELTRESPLTVSLSMYGGFEQVGSIGQSLPRDDVQTTTNAGDIVLYSGNQIVIFYGSNSWAYTRLGHITDQDAAGMKSLLGQGDVRITITLEN